ncbi:MAG: divalent metal cation transporter [Gemmatimonadales bacterium]
MHRLGPDWGAIAHGSLPTLPSSDRAHHWFLGVSIIGASVSPYLMYFYSSGAVEEKWDKSYLPVNSVIASIGTAFGAVLSVAVMIVAAIVLYPRGIKVDSFDQMAEMMRTPFPKWGIALFGISLGITCFGAAMEIALSISYMFGQGLGWNSTTSAPPVKEARFNTVHTAIIFAAAIPLLLGVDPIKVTTISMALTAVTLPLAIVPFLILMNDTDYVYEHTNGILGNTVVVIIMLIAFVIAVVAIPLQFLGGS